ncbi:MAG: response regulator transcription factor [Phycisphaerales bacterium]|nr:MAG: response regulator transcription factor [Phycisphaerales bacterium]
MSKHGTKPTVFVVDDDPGVGGSLRWLIESVGLDVEVHKSAPAFLESYEESKPGCLVADVRMPGMSGLALLEQLRNDGVTIPVILLSGHGDVSMAVQAMKSGAFDFIEKPFSDDLLLDRIQKAVQLDRETRRNRAQCRKTATQISSLTRREREVLDLVAAGLLNKEIAAELGLSIKTVETHRGHIMEKMGARTVADLIRTVLPLYEGASRNKIQRARHKASLDEQGRIK